ncbi:MAG: hypothetical protein ACTHOO_09125 [Alcanivorax sp.]
MSEKNKSAKNTTKAEVKEKITLSALKLASELGWSYLTLRDIAEDSGVSLDELYSYVEHKDDLLVLIGRMIDREVLKNVHIVDDASISPREHLFDIMMDRYDILNDHREGIVAILDGFFCDPKQLVISMPHLCRSMSWMLESAGICTSGIRGAIKVTGLTGVYLKVLKTWKDDDTQDLSKTMAALDKALDRAESIANSFGF